MSNIVNEFSINLPMIGVSSIGTKADVQPAACPIGTVSDITSDLQVVKDVSATCSHIQVFADSISVCNTFDEKCNTVFLDLVMTVQITNPETKTCCSYKVVKRVGVDKIKLACETEHMQPCEIIEAITPEDEQKLIAEQQAAAARSAAAKRARTLAGLGE